MTNHAQAMPCPVDGTALVMSERSGIEIDYCPACRGVWLDRGELDKIIERSAEQQAPAAPPPSQPQGRSWGASESSHGYGSGHYGHRKRKKSFLEELFD
jgi:Zn-finger nucleic acid-binding protein